MCEKPLLKAAKRKRDIYDFSSVFANTKELFEEADYVVGNLETVCAGREKRYTTELYSFNTPDSFLDALAGAGIDMVTMANNHCLDRGTDGAKRTVQLLNERGIEHVGIQCDSQSNSYFIKELAGMRIAFLNATYGTNTTTNHVLLDEQEAHMVRLMRAQQDNLYQADKKKGIGLRDIIMFLPKHIFTKEVKMKIKKSLGKEYNCPKIDEKYVESAIMPYLNLISKDIKKAREEADLVIYCPHIGGQFNELPGAYSEYVMNFLAQQEVDLIIGTHPHVVQKYEEKTCGEKKIPCVFSLGNYSLSPSSIYVLPDNQPEYGLIFHIYVEEKTIVKMSFSIVKMVEDKYHMLSVIPVDKLVKKISDVQCEKLERECAAVYNRFLGTNIERLTLKPEYEIKFGV